LISELYAYITEDDGNPIIPMAKRGDQFIPMIGDWDRVKYFTKEAELIAQTGKRVYLMRFTKAETVEVWDERKN